MTSNPEPPCVIFHFDHDNLVVVYERKHGEPKLIYTFERLASGVVEIFTRRGLVGSKPISTATFELPLENAAHAIVTTTDASQYADIWHTLPGGNEATQGLPDNADILIRERIPEYYK